MTRRVPHRSRPLLWAWLLFIVCVPLVFWTFMAWQEPIEPHEPYWFTGTWQEPDGRPGNQVTFTRPPGASDQPGAPTPAGATGQAIFSNYFAEGTVRVDWQAEEGGGVKGSPLVLHFTGAAPSSGVPAYVALRLIDDHNMQLRFANDAQTVRRKGFLEGDTSQILTRWP